MQRTLLKDEWRRQLAELETVTRLDVDLVAVETAVNHTFMLGRQLLQSFKSRHVQETDLAVFATDACFGLASPQLADAGSVHFGSQCGAYWQELTKDFDLSADMRAKAETALREYADELEHLRQEQASIAADLAQHLRTNAAHFYLGVDTASVHSYATKLAQLQLNYEAHWKAWERAMTDTAACLTPMQRAQLLLRKRSFLENASTLNDMWQAVNRQPPPSTMRDWEPTLCSLVPLPFHVCQSFLH